MVLIIVLLAVAVATATIVPLAQGQSPSWSTFVSSYDWVVATILIVLVIALALYATHQALGYPTPRRERRGRRFRRDESMTGPSGSDPAVNIARERYARGEITAEQLSQLVGQLQQSPRPPAGR